MLKRKLGKKHSQKAGLPPGTLIYTGDKTHKELVITTVIYNEQEYRQTVSKFFQECPVISPEDTTVTWIEAASSAAHTSRS